MSNISNDLFQPCTLAATCAAVSKILQPLAKDLGGFSVRRSLPTTYLEAIGPWVFFDHLGPANFAAGEGINVRPHPHIGIATVSYLFHGEILHRDSVGSIQAIKPGDVNLMVAGKGIVHSEREREEVNAVPHTAHGLQLWIALPAEKEDIDPAFYHYPSDSIPEVAVNDVRVKVLMGSAYGVTSPVKTFSETLYLEADIHQGQTLTLPASDELGLYVASGQLKIKETQVTQHSMAVFNHSVAVEVIALNDARVAIIGGRNLGKRYVDWNFVSSSKAKIAQARKDWQAGHFAKVPGDEDEFIPLPD